MKANKLILACACAAIAMQANAQEDPFDASISLGYVGTTGNTDTTTFNTEFLLTLRTENWTHNGKFQALGSQEDDQVTAERYYLEDKSDFNLDEAQYLYGKGTYTDDRFSGFDYQATLSAGYGRHLIRRDDFNLEAFSGVGYRENAIRNGDNVGEAVFTLGENVKWTISDNAALTQSFTTDIGEELTVSKFDIGLETNIIGSITTKIAFQARHISDVPVGTENTDTMTSVSLVYNF
jgi:putative salt-induced outer membrane protein